MTLLKLRSAIVPVGGLFSFSTFHVAINDAHLCPTMYTAGQARKATQILILVARGETVLWSGDDDRWTSAVRLVPAGRLPP